MTACPEPPPPNKQRTLEEPREEQERCASVCYHRNALYATWDHFQLTPALRTRKKYSPPPERGTHLRRPAVALLAGLHDAVAADGCAVRGLTQSVPDERAVPVLLQEGFKVPDAAAAKGFCPTETSKIKQLSIYMLTQLPLFTLSKSLCNSSTCSDAGTGAMVHWVSFSSLAEPDFTTHY